MTTTTKHLAADTTTGGQGGNAKGRKARIVGLVGTTALGVSLLIGVIIDRRQQTIPAFLADTPGAQQNALPEIAGAVPMQGVSEIRFLEQNIQLSLSAPAVVISGETACPLGGTAPCGVKNAPGAASDTRIWTGTCRAGGIDCLPDEDYAAPAPTVARPQGWTGQCRPNSIDCLPDEDLAVGAATHGTGTADENDRTSDGSSPGFTP